MRRFILSRYILREHLGPFCLSFAFIALIFLLDLVFRQLSRILSKGLPLGIVLEFFGLNLAWIVATAVPMAVLTATLMAFGRLAADQEITAMQTSGVSLRRLVTPVFITAGLLALGLIWFNNEVLPDFNYRARLLAGDIARKKPGVKIEPGVWFRGVPNYDLLVKTLEDSLGFSRLGEIIIADNTEANLQRTISAHSGALEPRPNEGLLLLTLVDGEIQEINIKKPEEFRRVKFAKHTISLQAGDGMFWRRSEADDRTDREKSVAQMRREIRENSDKIVWFAQRINLVVGLDLYQHWGRTCGLVPDSLLHFLDAPEPHENLLSQPKRSLAQIESLIKEMQRREYVAQALMVEIHKKYAIPVACFVFVLIGAPLGVLARRGGFVSGLSLSLGFFLLYWAFLISGEDFADRQLVSPFVAMWSANFIVGSFGIFVFSRVALGRMIPMSLRLPHSWRRLSFESLKKEFQREQKERLEKAWQWLQPQTVGAAQEIPVQIFGKKESADAELHVPEPALPRNPVPSPLSSTASLPQLEFTPIPEVLRNFTKSARADLILLANSNGEPLAFCETPTSLPRPPADLEMIAKLAASQMSTAQIAGQNLDEQEAYTCIFHEGARYNLFIYQISRDFILTALVEKTVALGVVRLHANETVSNLRKFLELFC